MDEDSVEIVMGTPFDIRADVRHVIDLLNGYEEDDDDPGEQEES